MPLHVGEQLSSKRWFWCPKCLENSQAWRKVACRECLERFWGGGAGRIGSAVKCDWDEWSWMFFRSAPSLISFTLLWRRRFSSLISMINESRLLRRCRGQEAERGRGGAYKSTRCDEFTLVWRTQLIRSISLIFFILQMSIKQKWVKRCTFPGRSGGCLRGRRSFVDDSADPDRSCDQCPVGTLVRRLKLSNKPHSCSTLISLCFIKTRTLFFVKMSIYEPIPKVYRQVEIC